MVSLGDDSRRHGGYFFDNPPDGGTHPDTDELLSESNVTLGADEDPGFRRIRTVWAIIIILICMVLLEVLVFLLPVVCLHWTHCHISPYSLIIYIHATLWFLLMLSDRYLRFQHYFSRTDGYLEFYRKTRNIRRMPLMVFSGGMAFLTVVVTVLGDYCYTEDHYPSDHTRLCTGQKFTPINYIQIVISLEMVIIIPILITYLVWTVKFNQRRASPDVNQDELLSSTFLQSQLQSPDVGFRDEDYLDEVLEKQADLIRYLKQHNANLGKRIVKLTAEVNRYKDTQPI